MSWKEPMMRQVAANIKAVLSNHPTAWDGRTAYDQIAEAANKAHPKEACGFVLATGHIVECTNIDEAPWYRYRIDPDEAEAWWSTGLVIAVWHSHPEAPAVPSEGDLEMAPADVEMWVYSVVDEDLGIYLSSGTLVRMESPP